ncbi:MULTISPECIES: metallophosphoesterase [Aerococcus]|uniref:Calcineurin-like phosphoesterase domain-containing protein n=1 Tax=Aerococcus tenax TaxID=3078812 RepID=A0A5N1BNV2_9LACT|nr:metallophosphoesterase [Aerococcus urinae]KAA9240271.1 hypothetical protein F6I34_05015 [Aerococcus urinae]MDK6597827.1 hypothetical protein [Aerococcus urinae]MDK7303343.1 hypothetical protein [Aerococcus urinae]MDK7802491.1 hypothetical protein [Aerococcus urinae]MDK8656131.1 hypothetical protein [Aerococcus urinae]
MSQKNQFLKKSLQSAAVIGGSLAYLYFQNYQLGKTHYLVESPRYAGGLEGVKIAHLSDLNFPDQRVKVVNILKAVKEEEVDLIAITGNLIHPEKAFDRQELAVFIKQLVNLAPVFYVSGSNEVKSPYSHLMEELLRQAGVRVLHDQAETITLHGQDLVVMGLAEKPGRHFLKGDALRYLPLEADQLALPKILLAHHPEAFLRYHESIEKSPDLVLAGHAQGGQIRIPGLGGLYASDQGHLPQYTEGVFRLPGDQYKCLVISRGIGVPKWHVRFNNQAELVVVQLTASKEAFLERKLAETDREIAAYGGLSWKQAKAILNNEVDEQLAAQTAQADLVPAESAREAETLAITGPDQDQSTKYLSIKEESDEV